MLPFDYYRAGSLAEASSLLRQHGEGGKVMAGGTALILIMKQGLYHPGYIVDVSRIKELQYIHYEPGNGVRIGALTRLRQMELSPVLQQHYPVITRAMARLANIRVRNVATIGGNLAHADTHLDLPPILMGLGAEVKVVSERGERWIPVESFFVDYYVSALEPDELVEEIRIPEPVKGVVGRYEKVTTLSATDWPCAGIAAFARTNGNKLEAVRLAISAVSPTPQRLLEVEALLEGQEPTDELLEEAGHKAAELMRPIPDARGSEWYKRQIVRVYVERAFRQLMRQGGAS